MQTKRVFDKNHRGSLDYLIYVPDQCDYSRKQLPLILFLHGMDKRGADIDAVRTDGLPKILEEKLDFPFIVVSPQCPPAEYWPMYRERVIALIDEVSREFNVDCSRVYATGSSMGGYGTWDLAMAVPERFAAVIPISEGCETENAYRLRNTPVWAFHGENDDVIPLHKMEEMVEAVRNAGGDVKLTILKNTGHDAWTPTYANMEVYDWLLKHTRR